MCTTEFNSNWKYGKLAVFIGVPRLRRTWSFHVVVLQRMAKKCTKICNAHAQPMFYSLNLLLGGVLVAVVVMVC